MAAARMAVRPAHCYELPGEVIAAGFAEGYFDVTCARRPRQSTIDCHDPERPFIGDLRGGIDRQVLAELRQCLARFSPAAFQLLAKGEAAISSASRAPVMAQRYQRLGCSRSTALTI
jgi:hypothetical protein